MDAHNDLNQTIKSILELVNEQSMDLWFACHISLVAPSYVRSGGFGDLWRSGTRTTAMILDVVGMVFAGLGALQGRYPLSMIPQTLTFEKFSVRRYPIKGFSLGNQFIQKLKTPIE